MAEHLVRTVGEHNIGVDFDRYNPDAPISGECYGCTTPYVPVPDLADPVQAVIDWANSHAAICRFSR